MSFSNHIFYEHINFDVSKKLYRSIAVKQGDTGSRGFFVRVIQNSEVIDISDMTMTFYCKKPDGTKVYIDAVKDGDKFRVDLTNQVSAVPGTVECELTLKGPDDEIISSKTFSITVEPSLQYGSMLSQSELSDFGRHLADYTAYIASELSEEHIPRALPNGVKDEVRVSEGKFVKRVSDEVKLWEILSTVLTGAESENFYALSWYSILTNFSHESSTNIQFARVNNYQGKGTSSYQEVQETDNYIWRISSAGAVNIKIPKADIEGDFTVAKGQQWLQQKQVTLTYQLAEPEIIDLPEVMSPNTRTLMHLIERLQKLEEYIST